ncbi:hypothetical protein CPB97_006154 [Podila verticillata]|nr:hypothetical protein CPB97_006154 [Podila verticillata]
MDQKRAFLTRKRMIQDWYCEVFVRFAKCHTVSNLVEEEVVDNTITHLSALLLAYPVKCCFLKAFIKQPMSSTLLKEVVDEQERRIEPKQDKEEEGMGDEEEDDDMKQEL